MAEIFGNPMRRLNVPGITTTGTAQNPATVPQRPAVSPYTPPPAPAPDPNRPITTGGSTPYTPPPAPAPDPNRPVTMSGAAVPGVGMSNAAYPPTTTYSAGSNLINAQVNPQASTRTTGAQGMADAAATRYAGQPTGIQASMNYGGVNSLLSKMGGMTGAPSFQAGGDTQKVRGLTLDQLMKTLEGTDRGQLAADAYGIMEERSRPEFDQRVRALGQKTAALGRIGSGIYGSNLTDLNSERERELGLNRRELANTSAGQTLSDRLAQLDAARGVGGDFFGQDATTSQINSANRAREFDQNMDLTRFSYGMERDKYGDAVSRDNTAYERGRDQFTTLGDYARGLGDEDRMGRNEVRGEREFQYGVNRDAVGDRFRQYELDQQGQRDRFGMMKDLGYGKDPNAARQYVSGQAGQSAAQNFGGGGELLGEYMYRRSGATDPRVRLPGSIYGESDRINDIVSGSGALGGRY
jgi:hypothetical protein